LSQILQPLLDRIKTLTAELQKLGEADGADAE